MCEGTLPAEVCGCSSNPISNKIAMSLRIVAGDATMSNSAEIRFEPTGSPVRVYSSMIALRIFCLRLSNSKAITSFLC